MSEERINGYLTGNYDALVISGSAPLALDIDLTTAATSGNVSAIDLDYTNTASGINNMRLLTADLTMGASCAGPYAGYFRTDCGAYQVLGLGAALGMELVLPGATVTSGQFHAMTIDVECPTSLAGLGSDGAGLHSFIKMEIWGNSTAKNNFDDGFNLFYFNGLTAGTDSLFSTTPSDKTDGKVNATLRVKVGSTSYWIPLWDVKDGS